MKRIAFPIYLVLCVVHIAALLIDDRHADLGLFNAFFLVAFFTKSLLMPVLIAFTFTVRPIQWLVVFALAFPGLAMLVCPSTEEVARKLCL